MFATLDQPQSVDVSNAVVFDKAFQTAQNRVNLSASGIPLAQWEVLITLFKHSIEIPCLLKLENAPTSEQHRTILTKLMALGEMVHERFKNADENFWNACGYNKDFVISNLNYLRGKYQDWYGVKDENLIQYDLENIVNELSKAS